MVPNGAVLYSGYKVNRILSPKQIFLPNLSSKVENKSSKSNLNKQQTKLKQIADEVL